VAHLSRSKYRALKSFDLSIKEAQIALAVFSSHDFGDGFVSLKAVDWGSVCKKISNA
jgi:hypothetical protein